MNKCICLSLALSLASLGGACLQADEPSAIRYANTPETTYVLGPEDQLAVHVVDLDEISDKPVRIDPNGYLEMPLIGRLHAAGLTVEQ
ncbi:MAG: polysaccharide biosynthesis/export family protein, partial [Acidobacteriota bacterium]|nr:polysaccharide biosynthesis/export family protein [Acidobacteriota bacterium]